MAYARLGTLHGVHDFRKKKASIRPKINCKLIQCTSVKGRELWNIFRKYHYLDHSLAPAAQTYALFHNNAPIAFCAIIHFPHNRIKNLKKVHRLVVLPEWQGLGIASILLEHVGKLYRKKGYKFNISTTHPALIHTLKRNPLWQYITRQRAGGHSGGIMDTPHSSRYITSFTFMEKSDII